MRRTFHSLFSFLHIHPDHSYICFFLSIFSFVWFDFAPRLTFIPSICFVLLYECAALPLDIFLSSPFLLAIATVHRAHCAWRSFRFDENFSTRFAPLFPARPQFIWKLINTIARLGEWSDGESSENRKGNFCVFFKCKLWAATLY